MKLSKGKISKAIHKNKQTLKKYKKNGRKNHKSKTFRKRHAINLDRTTLKNYKSLIGGAPEEEKHDDNPITEHNKEVVSEMTKSVEESAPEIVKPEEITTSASALAPEIVKPEEITTSASALAPEIVKPEEITTSALAPAPEIVKPEEITTSALAPAPEIVKPEEIVSDINNAKTDEIVKPEEVVSEMTKSGEESAPKILTHEEIITASPAPEIVKPEELAPEIIKPEEIIKSEEIKPSEIVKSDEIVASAPPAPQDIEKTTTPEQPIVEAVPVAPTQTSSVVVESIDKLADYIAERIKQKLQEQSDNDPFTKVTTANANISQ